MQEPVPTFKAGPNHVTKPVHLTDEAYTTAITSFVIVRTHIVAFSRSHRTLWLANRQVHSTKGWWDFGGRVGAGEPFFKAALRQIRQETGLCLTPERLQPLGKTRLIFQKQKEEPENTGQDSLVFHFGFQPADGEVLAMKRDLDPKEYDVGEGLRQFRRDQLAEAASPEAMRFVYDSIFPPFIAHPPLRHRLFDAFFPR